MGDEFRLKQVSAVREKLNELPPYMTVEEKDELLGSLLEVPVVTSEVEVSVVHMNGDTRNYVVPAFTSIAAMKGIISEAEGMPTGQMKLLHDVEQVNETTVMGSLVGDRMKMKMEQPPGMYDNLDDDDIGNMPDFEMGRQISNESKSSMNSNNSLTSAVSLTLVKQARMGFTRASLSAELSNKDLNVSFAGPGSALLEDCGPGSKVMARLLARGLGATYIGVVHSSVDVNQEPTMVDACLVFCTDMQPNSMLCQDGQVLDLQTARFVCGDVLSIQFAHDGQSFKVLHNGEKIGRIHLESLASKSGVVVACGGDQGTKWQILDPNTPGKWCPPKNVPLITHWDMNVCNVSATFKRVSFHGDHGGIVMLRGCGAGSTVIARAMQKGAGPLYIGVCRPTYALAHQPIVHGAHALLDNGGLCADSRQIGPVFGGFVVGDVLTLQVSEDGTAFALAKNGTGQVIVTHIPAQPEHVVCLGGVGPCHWEVA